MMNSKQVEEQEIKGRTIYCSLFTGMTWVGNPDRYGIWDLSGNTSNTANAVVKSTSTNIYAEVKVREINSTSYLTTFLEAKKYNNLLQLDGQAFYFVAYQDHSAFLFDLKSIKNIDQYWTKRWMLEVTLDNQKKLVEKEIYDLPLVLAVKKYKII